MFLDFVKIWENENHRKQFSAYFMQCLCLLTYRMTSFMARYKNSSKAAKERSFGEKVFFRFEDIISNYLKSEPNP